MPSSTKAPARSRIAFRCDGDELSGAGHVGRCVALAAAFQALGWEVCFVGDYEGLAAWLLARAGMPMRPAEADAPCGVEPERCDAAVVDSYRIAEAEICELARSLPVATIAEANRCPSRGILLDYHLDRAEPPSPSLLAGPSFTPLDPAFAGAGRAMRHAGHDVGTVLVTLGASSMATTLLTKVVPIVERAFPDAEILLVGEPPGTGALSPAGGPAPTAEPRARRSRGGSRVVGLPRRTALVDVAPRVDLAVTAAGLTAYELACAGIPQVAIAIAENQRRVVRGLRDRELAPCLDLTAGDSLTELPATLERLKDEALRKRLAERGMLTFDGEGALRAARTLAALFGAYGERGGGLPAAAAQD